MPRSLVASDHGATVRWLGRVADRAAGVPSQPTEALDLRFGGGAGEAHAGATRASCGRVTQLHPLGTEIANSRQISLVSTEDLAEIAREMGVATLDPAWLGVSIAVTGLPDFTHLPPSSRLQAPDGATLVIDMENQPCTLAGKSVDMFLAGQGPKFKPAALGRRGVTAWVERPGRIALGDRLRLFVPGQRPWQP